MSELLLYYKRPDPTTWVYMSSFLTIGLFFVFHRFWSVRNLDIVLLILLAPGLLMVHEGRRRELRQLESEAIAAREAAALKPAAGHQSSNRPTTASKLVAIHSQPLASDSRSRTAQAEVFWRERHEPSLRLPIQQKKSRPTRQPLMMTALVQVDAQEVEAALGEQLDRAALATEPGNENADQEKAANLETAEEREPVSAVLGYTPQDIQYYGFLTLFVVQSLILVRLLIDPLMVRRPLLNPNLTTGGLYFISISLFVFMMGNVVTSTPRMQVWQGPELGPGYALMRQLPTITTRPVSSALAGVEPPTEAELDPSQRRATMVAKILAILAHLAIVSGVVLIGGRHFGNLRAGVGCAALYLMLPYTAQMTGRVDHALPAALLLWAVLMYRRPTVAGIFFGLAAGLVYYPLFLLPLWVSFYWQRGVRRYLIGVAATLAVLVLLLSLEGTGALFVQFRRMFGLIQWEMQPRGIWGLGWNPIWRMPVIVGFVILSVFFAVWPSPKNLGTLISCSGAVMVAAQFWHGDGGGLYIAWFLPLLLLTIFRPNLQDRVALKVVEGGTAGTLPRSRLEVKSA